MTGRALAAIVALSLVAVAAMGAGSEVVPPSLTGVRSIGMGDASVSDAEGVESLFHNPAGLGLGRGIHLSGQTNVTGRDALKLDPKGITYRWRGWGLGWGNRIAIQDRGISDYNYVGLGKRLSAHVAVGVGTKLWRTHPSEHFQALGKSATFDVGVLAAPAEWLRIGGRAGQRERGGGIAAGSIGAVGRYRATRVAVQADWRRGATVGVSAGIEWRPVSPLAVRVGLRRGSPTFGAGVQLGPLALDVASTRVASRRFVFVGATVRVATDALRGLERTVSER